MRLRQVVLVAEDLEARAEELQAVLGLGEPYRDPGVGEFGLANVVFPVGDTFLEVVSPVQERTAAGRYLERRGGDGGYMVILQVDDTDLYRRRMADLGIRVVWLADHEDIKGTHLHPADVGGVILSLDEAAPVESWRWAGPGWRDRAATSRVREITGVRLQADDPSALAQRWGEVLDREVETTAGAGYEIRLDRGCLRFVAASDGRGDGVAAFDLAVADPAAMESAARGRGLPVTEAGIEVGGVRLTWT